MKFSKIQIIGTLDRIDEIKEACRKLPENTILNSNSIEPIVEKLGTNEKGCVHIYPPMLRMFEPVIIPENAKDVSSYSTHIVFSYSDINYCIHYRPRISKSVTTIVEMD